MNSLSFVSLLVIANIVFGQCAGIPRPLPVTVNKCCRIGEWLDEQHQCNIGGDIGDNWWPTIFMILKQTYFAPNGSAPRFFRIRERIHPFCQNVDYVIGAHSMALFSNGSLYLSQKHKFIEPNDFCVDKNIAIICDPDNNSPDALMLHQKPKPTTLRKCCGNSAVYRNNENTCVPSKSSNDKLLKGSVHVNFAYAFPECKLNKSNLHLTIAEKFNETNLDSETGRLILKTGRVVDTKSYCLEHVFVNNLNDETSGVHVFICDDQLSMHSDHVQNNPMDIRFILFPIGLLISVVFLSTTLAIRYAMPSNHHHILHWRCQTFYVTCLLIGDLLLAFTQLFGRNGKGFACVTIDVCMLFFFLSAFFWLNTMCFNIWWTFRDFRPTNLERSQEKVRLLIYKVYALGIPFGISAFALFQHLRQSLSAENSFLQPRFCEKEYWFNGFWGKLTYFYGPIGILLLINFSLFASTTRQLTCGLWKRDEVKSTTERTKLGVVCLKLILVMGVTWIADVISWIHGVWYGDPHYIWMITDLINALQGVLIFLVIGCQPQVTSTIKHSWRNRNTKYHSQDINAVQRNSSSYPADESLTNSTFDTNAKIMAETTF